MKQEHDIDAWGGMKGNNGHINGVLVYTRTMTKRAIFSVSDVNHCTTSMTLRKNLANGLQKACVRLRKAIHKDLGKDRGRPVERCEGYEGSPSIANNIR